MLSKFCFSWPTRREQIATNYRSQFQRPWVSKGKMAVQCLEHSRIRTLNVTLSRKPSAIAPCGSAGSKRLHECCDSAGPRLAPRKFYSRNERGRHLRRRQINRMTKKVKTKSAALKAR